MDIRIDYLGLIALLMIMVAAFVLGQKITTAMRQARRSWTSTTGKIVRSQVEAQQGRATGYNPKVVYEYEVRGRLYRCRTIQVAKQRFLRSTWLDAYDVVEEYPEGERVTVYYNPDEPAEAVLEK